MTSARYPSAQGDAVCGMTPGMAEVVSIRAPAASRAMVPAGEDRVARSNP